MKHQLIKGLLCLFVFSLMYSCTGADQAVADENQAQENAEQTIEKPAAPKIPVILGASFQGINVGDAIASHESTIERATLSDGEGNHDVYKILNGYSESMAYFHPDPNDEKLVGEIVINSPRPKTEKGIGLGQTYAELLAAYGDVEVHGSEIEGRTYANAGKLLFMLDAANFSYDIDKTKIKPETEILEIQISR